MGDLREGLVLLGPVKFCGVPGRTCLDLALGPVMGTGTVFSLRVCRLQVLVWSHSCYYCFWEAFVELYSQEKFLEKGEPNTLPPSLPSIV